MVLCSTFSACHFALMSRMLMSVKDLWHLLCSLSNCFSFLLFREPSTAVVRDCKSLHCFPTPIVIKLGIVKLFL